MSEPWHDYNGLYKIIRAFEFEIGDFFIDDFMRAHEVLAVEHGVRSTQTGENTVVIDLPPLKDERKNRRLHLRPMEGCRVAVEMVK